MKILNINEAQLDELATLYVKVFKAKPWSENWEHHWALERLKNFHQDKQSIGFYAIKNEKIVGAILGRGNNFQGNLEFEICELFIDPLEQGSGLGSKLLAHLESNLKDLNIHIITLLTSKRVPAFDFYLKKGFEESEDIQFLYKVY